MPQTPSRLIFFKQKLHRVVYSKIGPKMNTFYSKNKFNFRISTVKEKLSNPNFKKVDLVAMETYDKKENEAGAAHTIYIIPTQPPAGVQTSFLSLARYTLFANKDEKGTNGRNPCELRIVCRE